LNRMRLLYPAVLEAYATQHDRNKTRKRRGCGFRRSGGLLQYGALVMGVKSSISESRRPEMDGDAGRGDEEVAASADEDHYGEWATMATIAAQSESLTAKSVSL